MCRNAIVFAMSQHVESHVAVLKFRNTGTVLRSRVLKMSITLTMNREALKIRVTGAINRRDLTMCVTLTVNRRTLEMRVTFDMNREALNVCVTLAIKGRLRRSALRSL
jgi:hypothetical protein